MEMQNFFSVQEIIRLAQVYRTQFLTGLAVVCMTLGGLVYWQYNRINREKNALQAFAEVLTEYNQAYNNNELWQDIEVGSRTGYRQYSSSSIAPYFLGIQVEALIQQDKFDEALLLMRTMMNKLSKNNPLYNAYAIKWACMKLASVDKINQEEGLRELIKFSEDNSNPQQLQAQYNLGLYYQNSNQEEKAQEIWKKLAETKEDLPETSPWVVLAQQKLQ